MIKERIDLPEYRGVEATCWREGSLIVGEGETPDGWVWFEGGDGEELEKSFHRAVDEHLKVRP